MLLRGVAAARPCSMVVDMRTLLLWVVVQESVDSLRDQVRVLRSQKRRDVVLANLPPVRPDSVVMPRGRNACAAIALCKRLQGAVVHAPKASPYGAAHWLRLY